MVSCFFPDFCDRKNWVYRCFQTAVGVIGHKTRHGVAVINHIDSYKHSHATCCAIYEAVRPPDAAQNQDMSGLNCTASSAIFYGWRRRRTDDFGQVTFHFHSRVHNYSKQPVIIVRGAYFYISLEWQWGWMVSNINECYTVDEIRENPRWARFRCFGQIKQSLHGHSVTSYIVWHAGVPGYICVWLCSPGDCWRLRTSPWFLAHQCLQGSAQSSYN
jgi:hypothetical protein